MNHKLIKASVAAAAAIGLAASGSTFAQWTDWDTLGGSNVGADVMSLELTESGSADFDNLKMAPGDRGDYEFVIVNRTGTTVDLAKLTMFMENLASEENGCATANSEQALDGDCATNPEGEFDDQATFGVNASSPTTDVANACSDPRGQRQAATSIRNFANTKYDKDHALPLTIGGDHLAPGEGICVGMGIALPEAATDAVQGDEVSFDLTFFLEQITPEVP